MNFIKTKWVIKWNIDKNIVCSIHLFIVAVSIFLLTINSGSLLFLQYLLISVFIENCLMSLCGAFFNLYQIFLGTSFLFVYGRVFLDALGFCDFRVLNLWENGYMAEQDALVLLTMLILFLLGTSLAWTINLYYGNRFEAKNQQYFNMQRCSSVGNILQYTYYMLVLLCLIKVLIIVVQVNQNGYVWIHNGGLQKYHFPLVLRVQTLTDVVFPVLLFYIREPRKVKINIFLYLLYQGLRLLTGQRAPVFITLLLLMWFYSTYYKRIKTWKIILIGVVAIIMIQMIAIYRGDSISQTNSLFYNVLYVQGVSLLVPAGVIRFMGAFSNNVPFVFGYFIDYFAAMFNPELRMGQNMERIYNGNYLGDHLTYMISPYRYLNGNGTGTSIIAELIELVDGNYAMFFICSFLVMMGILFAASRLYKNIFIFTVVFHILYYFIFSPRDSIFKAVGITIYSLLIAAALKPFEYRKSDNDLD